MPKQMCKVKTFYKSFKIRQEKRVDPCSFDLLFPQRLTKLYFFVPARELCMAVFNFVISTKSLTSSCKISVVGGALGVQLL